jgi:hypothetical protein
MDDQTIQAVCGGSIILLLLAALAIFLMGRRHFTCRKRRAGDSAILTVTARRNLRKIVVLARFDGEDMSFERMRVRKGQSVEFSFPWSDKKTKVTVEAESGSAQAAEV